MCIGDVPLSRINIHVCVFLNSISNNSENFDNLRKIINEIDNVTLVKFKSVTKSYMINQYSHYCNIPSCYICQL